TMASSRSRYCFMVSVRKGWLSLRRSLHSWMVSDALRRYRPGRDDPFYPFCDLLWGNRMHAAVIAEDARPVAEDRTGPAGHVGLYSIGRVLPVAVKSRERMRRAPNGNHGYAQQRGDVHGGGVHGYHRVEVGDEVHLLRHVHAPDDRNHS